jgi:hypothetical protein
MGCSRGRLAGAWRRRMESRLWLIDASDDEGVYTH